MFVVVAGARERKSEVDEAIVSEVLEKLRQKYGLNLVVVSTACDRGTGAFVKATCLKDETTYQFIEVSVRIFAKLPKTKLVNVYLARNPMLIELGDEFHIFVTEGGGGTMEDLITRVRRTGRPLYVYGPGVTEGQRIEP